MSRIVLFMTGARGEAVLGALKAAGHEVSQIVRDGAVNSAGFIKDLGTPDLLVVAGFPQIFGDELLAVAPAINLHAGPLPRYRGGSPLNWQIINGEHEIGLSIIEMDRGVDTGPVLAERSFHLGGHETIAGAHHKANELFCEMVVEVVAQVATNTTRPREQSAEDTVYWHQRNKEDGRIFWRDMSAEQMVNLVRAVTRPYPGAFSKWSGGDVRIWEAIVPTRVVKGVPGRVVYLNGEGPFIVAADRAVQVTEYEVEAAWARPGEGAPLKLPHGAHLE